MIIANAVSKSFSTHEQSVLIIDQLNLTVAQGQSVSIQGPSGCGKSTLLYILSGLATADSGDITVAEHQLNNLSETQQDAFRRHSIGLVFQQFHLIDCLTVWANITFTARLADKVDVDHLDNLCEKLGLTAHKHKAVNQLSGGEQQRVALARALAHKPKVLFADEPTGNLDELTSQAVSELMYTTCAELNITLLIVTHSKDVAKRADVGYQMHLGKLISVNEVGPQSIGLR